MQFSTPCDRREVGRVNRGKRGAWRYDEPHGAYWRIDLEPRTPVTSSSVGSWPGGLADVDARGDPRLLPRRLASELVPIGRVVRPFGSVSFVPRADHRFDDVLRQWERCLASYSEPAGRSRCRSAGAQGRPVIPARAARRAGQRRCGARGSSPLEEGAYYAFHSSACRRGGGGRVVGRVQCVPRLPCESDVSRLDSGLSLPLVEVCVAEVDLEGGPNRYWRQLCRPENRRLHPRPACVAWLTEQQPLPASRDGARAAPDQLPETTPAARGSGR